MAETYLEVQVLAGSSEQLVAAQKEVEVMSLLHHPNLLPLLSHTTVDTYNNGRLLQLVYMLFPVYQVMVVCMLNSSLLRTMMPQGISHT